MSLDLGWLDTQLRTVGIWDRRTQTFITRNDRRAGEAAPGIKVARWGDVAGQIMCAADSMVAGHMSIYRDAAADSNDCTSVARQAFLSRKTEPDLPYIKDHRELFISFEDMALSRSDMTVVAEKHAQEFIRIDELNRGRCREIRAMQVRTGQIVAEAEADPDHPWHQVRAILEALGQCGKTVLVKWHGRDKEKREERGFLRKGLVEESIDPASIDMLRFQGQLLYSRPGT